ncbi:MAG: sigma factor-like helix-turn-helix DNA-binding protein [Gammaproteobacteria bacterium]|nr:sigma factor-like helix-turn-helix DNA-binding protein [Gammaproteobacteria bacterium]
MANTNALALIAALALDYLPNRYGDALEYKYIEGLSIKEMAVRMQIGTEAVQSDITNI